MKESKNNAPKHTVTDISCERSIDELMLAARGGDASAVPALRRALLANPGLMRANGDVACRTQVLWVDLIAGNDFFRRECLLISMGNLKQQLLADTNGTVAEQMLVELAISTWLQLFYHEQKEAAAPATNPTVGEFRLRKIESAFNRHMKALNALSALKQVRFTQRMAETMAALAGARQDTLDGSGGGRRSRRPVNRLDAVCRN